MGRKNKSPLSKEIGDPSKYKVDPPMVSSNGDGKIENPKANKNSKALNKVEDGDGKPAPKATMVETSSLETMEINDNGVEKVEIVANTRSDLSDDDDGEFPMLKSHAPPPPAKVVPPLAKVAPPPELPSQDPPPPAMVVQEGSGPMEESDVNPNSKVALEIGIGGKPNVAKSNNPLLAPLPLVSTKLGKASLDPSHVPSKPPNVTSSLNLGQNTSLSTTFPNNNVDPPLSSMPTHHAKLNPAPQIQNNQKNGAPKPAEPLPIADAMITQTLPSAGAPNPTTTPHDSSLAMTPELGVANRANTPPQLDKTHPIGHVGTSASALKTYARALVSNGTTHGTTLRPSTSNPRPNAWASHSKKIFMNSGLGGKLEYTPPTSNRVSIKCSEGLPKQEVWGWSLLGQYVGFHPGNFLINELRRQWGVRSRYREEEGRMIFNFDSEEDCDQVLKGGPYFIHGKPLILKHIPDKFAFNRKDIATIPLWVRMYGLSKDYWTTPILGRVASHIGKPLYMDPVTNERKRGAYARVLVEINFATTITREIALDFDDGVSLDCKFLIENEPLYCQGCCSFGHDHEECSFKEKREAVGVMAKRNSKASKSIARRRDEPAGDGSSLEGNGNKESAPPNDSIMKGPMSPNVGTTSNNEAPKDMSTSKRAGGNGKQKKGGAKPKAPSLSEKQGENGSLSETHGKANTLSTLEEIEGETENESDSSSESGRETQESESKEEVDRTPGVSSSKEVVASMEEDDEVSVKSIEDGRGGSREEEAPFEAYMSKSGKKKARREMHKVTVLGLRNQGKWSSTYTRTTRSSVRAEKDKAKAVAS